jgi:hypothetical protein
MVGFLERVLQAAGEQKQTARCVALGGPSFREQRGVVNGQRAWATPSSSSDKGAEMNFTASI